MGCSSSKVGQKPLGPATNSTKDPEDEKGREASAEESRAALPVPASAEETKGKSAGARQDGGATSQTKVHEEVEGKTITDESGLEMRTPRRSDDRSLHFAAKRGDLPLVLNLLANASGIGAPTGGEDNATKSKGDCCPTTTAPNTPFAGIDERGMWGNTPLLVATQYGHAHVALALINGGADLCVENERHATALHYCCAEGLLDVGRALLSNEVDADPPSAAVHHPGIDGGRTVPLTPLSAAAIGGHAELVQLLVEVGAEVDRRVPPQGPNLREPKDGYSCEDNTGMTALMGAARYGHTDTCLLLINNGARLLAKDSDTRTALMHAIQGRHEHTAQALLDAARVTGLERCLSEAGESSGGGLTPLQFACSERLGRVVKALLVAGADTEARDSTGATALLRSCRTGCVACARELLSRRADPLAADNEGDTPLLATRTNKNTTNGTELLQLVEAAAAAVEAPVEQRQTGEHPQTDAAAVRIIGGTVSDNPNDDEQEEEKEEDVLLVSDWKQEEEFDNCDVWGGAIPISGITGRNHSRDGQGSHGVQPHMSEKSSITRMDDDEDDDVLLAGDFELETAGERSCFVGPSIGEGERCDTGPVKPSSGSQKIADEQSERERRHPSTEISTGKVADRHDQSQEIRSRGFSWELIALQVAVESVGDMVAAAILRATTPNDRPLDG